MSAYQTRFSDGIGETIKAARAAEVARCVAAFEGDKTLTWCELLARFLQPVVDDAKIVCKAHGTYPRKDSRGTALRHSGRW
ncbi:MAG: hypothetical protein WC642_08475 [Nocardioides sp.]|jgi:hypothetical protein